MNRGSETRIPLRIVSGTISFFIGGIWFMGCNSVHGQDDSPLMKRFLTDAPKAWKQQQAFYATLEGNIRTESKSGSGDGKWKTKLRKGMVKTYNENALDQLEAFDSGAWSGHVTGINSEYTFRLTRASDAKPWAIAEVKKTDDITLARMTGKG
jgi:hypothetical protein